MIIENYDIGAVKRRYIDDPLIGGSSIYYVLVINTHGRAWVKESAEVFPE